MDAIVMGHADRVERVFGSGRMERLRSLVDLRPGVVSAADLIVARGEFAAVRYVFSTWGMPRFDAPHLAAMPGLEAVFYAAGSVQGFARPLLERGVKVFSAWAANGIPVAEFTVAQMVLSCKRYFENTRLCRDPERRGRGPFPQAPGVFGETVAIVGAGMIGRKVVELLKPYALSVLAVDPYLADGDAARLGVTKVGLDEAFERAYVVSNHLPNLPSTRGMIGEAQFARMREGATFINTGRGAQVDEAGLAGVLERRPDLTALLDVTDPEPPAPASALYRLPNVQLSSHIAGSLGDEVVRMADFMLDEFERFQRGEPTRHGVTLAMLETMA